MARLFRCEENSLSKLKGQRDGSKKAWSPPDKAGGKELAPARSQFEKRRTWTGVAVIIAITLLAYLPAFGAGYVWDDGNHVPQGAFQGSVTFLKWIWLKPGATPQYYPFTHTVFWIEWQIWGSHAAGYHAVNVVLQMANALLLWRLLWRLEVAGAWIIAAVFAVHPMNVESVAWVTEQKNTLSGFFYLLSFLLAIRAWGIEKAGQAPGAAAAAKADWLAYGLCLTCFVAAVLCKTVTSTLLAALVLILWWKHKRFTKRTVLMLLPLFGVALGVAALTSGMEQWNVGAYGPEFRLSIFQRVLIAGRAICFYAWKLSWPTRLSFIYSRWDVDAGRFWQWLFPAAVVSVISVLFFYRNRIGQGAFMRSVILRGHTFSGVGLHQRVPDAIQFCGGSFPVFGRNWFFGVGRRVVLEVGKSDVDARWRGCVDLDRAVDSDLSAMHAIQG